MDEQAIKRAALVTVRRAICERFPPGPERRTWLRTTDRVLALQLPLLSPVCYGLAQRKPYVANLIKPPDGLLVLSLRARRGRDA